MPVNDSLIDVKEAAAQMGVDYSTIQAGLKQGRFPFGTAVQGKKTWRYIIIRVRFETYMNARDMRQPDSA